MKGEKAASVGGLFHSRVAYFGQCPSSRPATTTASASLTRRAADSVTSCVITTSSKRQRHDCRQQAERTGRGNRDDDGRPPQRDDLEQLFGA